MADSSHRRDGTISSGLAATAWHILESSTILPILFEERRGRGGLLLAAATGRAGLVIFFPPNALLVAGKDDRKRNGHGPHAPEIPRYRGAGFTNALLSWEGKKRVSIQAGN